MLSKQQQKILNIIIKYIEEEGIAPSVREIGDLAGLTSTSTVFGHLRRLEKAGHITVRKDIPRGITIKEDSCVERGFGNRIRRLREKAEMTQAELGEKIGVSDRVLAYYEANERFPRKAELLIKFAEIFDVTVDYLVRGEVESGEEVLPQYGDIRNLEALECASTLENLFKGKVLESSEKDEIFRVVSMLYFEGKKTDLEKLN